MELSMLEAVVLSIIQGLTEWLPISSSGHLAVANILMGTDMPLLFSLALHAGTLGAVFFVFRSDLADMARSLPRIFKNMLLLRSPAMEDKDAWFTLYVLAASIPAALAGYYLKNTAEETFSNTLFLAAAFTFTGLLLLSTRNITAKKNVNMKRGLVVGIAQIATIFPAVSRSGVTISTSLHTGIERREAARFSFILSIPLILGSTIYEASISTSTGALLPQMIVGGLISFMVGILSLKFLLAVISRGRLYLFAPYCLFMGFAMLLLSIL